MQIKNFILPSAALGAAALILLPSEEAVGFSKIGGSLSLNQRDFRVFDNFADASANNNTNANANWPGWLGVELAVWKGAADWNSAPHGVASGDPTQPVVGDGNANFDSAFMGSASGVGTSDHNIVSTIASCGALAFTETPISNGWRIRFCDNWTWDDGPTGSIGNRFDIQGVMTHEYGHALGLGHSGFGAATMAPSVGAGQTSIRSIHSDDIAGLQCIYGVKNANKPLITGTDPDPGAGTLQILGSNFAPTGNRVWFTNATVTSTSGDPRVIVSNVASTNNGSVITVNIPANAGPGGVLVEVPGGGFEDLSNPFGTDLVNPLGGSPPAPFGPTGTIPAQILSLNPGTAQDVTIEGNGFLDVTSIDLGLTTVDPSRWTIVNDTTITIDMPQTNLLGANTLTLFTPTENAGILIDIVAPDEPKLELGTGDPLNVVTPATGVDVVVAGQPGEVVQVWYSASNVGSNHPLVCLGIGNNFSGLFRAKNYTIPARSWTSENIPLGPQTGNATFYSQGLIVNSTGPGGKWKVSNVQSLVLAP